MKRALTSIFISLSIMTACTEKIDIELDDTYERLVVDGFITTDTTAHTIVLTKTSSYYYNEPPPAVTNAQVVIADDLGNEIPLVETGPGNYETPQEGHAVVGRTYTLRITLDGAIDGSTYYEASSQVKPVYEIDSIRLAFRDWGEDGFYEVQCYYQDPPEKNFYLFNIFKNGELITDTMDKRFITDDEFYNGNYTNGIGVGYLNQSIKRERLYDGDVITFQAANIEESHARFIWQLQEEAGYQLPLFSGPPANVNGNISGGAIGYFAAYAVTYSSVIHNEL